MTRPNSQPLLIETDWQTWLREVFSQYLVNARGEPVGFAEHHALFWRWVWSIERGKRPAPFVAIWPRGGAKSTSAEMACPMVGARGRRRYVLYVSDTQDQADDHVQNVGTMLESDAIAAHYPAMADRMVGKYGSSKGWRRDRLRTASSFTIDAIGLDTAARGVKLDAERPDLIVLDDLDDELDTLETVQKKVLTLTHALLPAGAEDAAVLAVQNLVHRNGIFAQLADGRADFLADRVVSGPHPALEQFAWEQRGGRFYVTAGVPTWEGMGVERCQALIDQIGITAFRNECQHEILEPAGGMFDHLEYERCTAEAMPDLVRTTCWVDPAVTDTDQSDAHAIQVDSLGTDGRVYRRWSWEHRATPLESISTAIRKAVEFGAEHVGIETDQGGDTWQSVYREAARSLVDDGVIAADQVPMMTWDKAGASQMSKTERAGRMLAKGYELGLVVHVIGTHGMLERALRRFPLKKPFDLTDAAYWSWRDLADRKPGWDLVNQSAAISRSDEPQGHRSPTSVYRTRTPDEVAEQRRKAYEAMLNGDDE